MEVEKWICYNIKKYGKILDDYEKTRGLTTVWLENERRWQEDWTKTGSYKECLSIYSKFLEKKNIIEECKRYEKFRNNIGRNEFYKIYFYKFGRDGKTFHTGNWGSFLDLESICVGSCTIGFINKKYIYPVDFCPITSCSQGYSLSYWLEKFEKENYNELIHYRRSNQ